jgi:ATP-dependent exoDNAse (exonuclease V) alpha subunit
MAIYHFNAKVIGRASGKSATAASAYIRAVRIRDCLSGKSFDYTKKKGVVYSEILAPKDAPDWIKNPETLWNAVELREEQSKLSKKAQLAREITVGLPKELNLKQQIELLYAFVQENFVSHGMVADLNIHHDNPNNPHAHFLLTMRKLEGEGFGNKVREWNSKSFLKIVRKNWAEAANEHLQKAGYDQRIYAESYQELGLKKKPTIHLGRKTSRALERGVELIRYLRNKQIKSANTYVGIKEEIGKVGLFIHKKPQVDPIKQETIDKLLRESRKHSKAVPAA